MEGLGMDAEQVRELKPRLTEYLKQFADCFDRRDTRAYLSVYVSGQLSNLSEKSCEPIALAAGVPPRTLQQFLSFYKWAESRARRRLQEIVVRDHGGPHSIGIVDETSDVKQGDKTPGVQRQWCGTRGKKENCIVTVHLGYAQGNFHCLLDGDLFLPESWAADRERCRAAGIPDEVEYRPKWQIALDLLDRTREQGVTFDWLTQDEGYGGKPEYLRQLDQRGQKFVAEVPKSFTGWISPPAVTRRPFRRGRGRGRKTPRLISGSRPATSVEHMLQYSPALRDQPWVKYHVKNGEKGPQVWEVKHTRFTMKDEQGLPGLQLHLVVARNVLDPSEIKYFVSNAPPQTKVETLLLVGFSRWRVERCFEDHKQEVGLDQWEGRCWLGLQRHLILSCISYLFLARVNQELRGKKSRVDCLPGASGDRSARSQLVAYRPSFSPPHRSRRENCPALATT
jgi:SRSO17 transposase